MLCQDCPKKEICYELCKEAEEHVRQDEVYQREKTIGLPSHGDFPELTSNIPLTKREKQILTLLGQKLPRKDICQLLNISRGNLRWYLNKLKKKF